MISVIIPSWNGRHLLETALPSLIKQLPKQVSVIVVDNGSTDGTVEWINENWKTVITMALPENLGFSGAVNTGIAAAGEDDIILLNNDTEALPGWLNALLEARDKFPDFHVFTSRVLYAEPPHLIDTVGDGFTIAGFGYKKGWLEQDGTDFDKHKEVFSASGCAMLIRREVIKEIGLFDEDFFAFGEDIDFSFRARLAGFRVLYVPDAKLYHSVRSTAAPKQTLYWYHRNLVWILVKNLPFYLWLLYWPHILAHMIWIGIRSLAGNWFVIYCRSLASACYGIPKKMKQRSDIQNARNVKIKDIRELIDSNWVGVHWQLYRKKRAWKSKKGNTNEVYSK
ncbi:MAG: glycosyltransferase family 2 protein [bacterium]